MKISCYWLRVKLLVAVEPFSETSMENYTKDSTEAVIRCDNIITKHFQYDATGTDSQTPDCSR